MYEPFHNGGYVRKTYSMPDKYVNYVKEGAQELGIAESDMLRRILDQYMEQKKKNDKSH
jgi:hypothetical protein